MAVECRERLRQPDPTAICQTGAYAPEGGRNAAPSSLMVRSTC